MAWRLTGFIIYWLSKFRRLKGFSVLYYNNYPNLLYLSIFFSICSFKQLIELVNYYFRILDNNTSENFNHRTCPCSILSVSYRLYSNNKSCKKVPEKMSLNWGKAILVFKRLKHKSLLKCKASHSHVFFFSLTVCDFVLLKHFLETARLMCVKKVWFFVRGPFCLKLQVVVSNF
jgi:hypothetical protein